MFVKQVSGQCQAKAGVSRGLDPPANSNQWWQQGLGDLAPMAG